MNNEYWINNIFLTQLSSIPLTLPKYIFYPSNFILVQLTFIQAKFYYSYDLTIKLSFNYILLNFLNLNVLYVYILVCLLFSQNFAFTLNVYLAFPSKLPNTYVVTPTWPWLISYNRLLVTVQWVQVLNIHLYTIQKVIQISTI